MDIALIHKMLQEYPGGKKYRISIPRKPDKREKAKKRHRHDGMMHMIRTDIQKTVRTPGYTQCAGGKNITGNNEKDKYQE